MRAEQSTKKWRPVWTFVSVVIPLFLLVSTVQAKVAPTLVSTKWLDEHKGDKGLVLLDIRTKANYEFAHLPNAVNIPYEMLDIKCKNDCFLMPPEKIITKMLQSVGVNADSWVVVYGHGNSVSDATKTAAAYWVLKANGVSKLSMLNGGVTKWTFEGRVVTKDVPTPGSGNFVAKANSSLIATFKEVAKVLKGESKTVFVDARSPAQHFGHQKRGDVACYGHIPGSVSLPADFLLNAGINRAPATVKAKEELRKIVLGVGVPSDKSASIIVYCNTGQLAGLNYMVLAHILGYRNVKLYDGSMVEYCKSRGKLPLARFSWDMKMNGCQSK